MAKGRQIPNVRTVTKEDELSDAAQMLRKGNGTSFVLLKVAPTKPPTIYRSRDASWHKGKFREVLLGRIKRQLDTDDFHIVVLSFFC